TRRLEETRERTERLTMIGHDLEDAAVEGGRAVRSTHCVLFEERPPAEQLDLVRRVRAPHAVPEKPPQIGPSVRLTETPIERQGARLRVALFVLEELFVRGDRLVDLPELVRVQLRKLFPERAALLRLHLLRAAPRGEHVDQRRVIACRARRRL